MKKMMQGVTTLAVMLTAILTNAMPSYDDVLVVVNVDSPQSVEIGAYFQEKRHIPSQNICRVRTKDTQLASDTSLMAPEDEASVITSIKKYLVDNNLENKINYIVLTRGIPYWAKHTVPEYAEDTVWRHLFDLQLLTSLGNLKYNSGSIFKFNPFYYYINDNFGNLADYAFSKAKYGYYIVTRLDGPGVSGIKQMIDNSGYPAYNAYDKNNIKYMVIPPKFTTGSSSKITEIGKRTNIKIVYPDMYDNNTYTAFSLPGGSGETQRDVAKGISFCYFDWVGWETEFTTFYSNGEASGLYPSPYRGIEFLPGGVVEAFRSHPALYMNRNTGGVTELDPSPNKSRDFKKYYSGDDLRFRHLTAVAYDPINNCVWCGTGDSPFNEGQNYGDSKVTDTQKQKYAKHRGGGIGIFDVATGDIAKHFSPDSTAFYTPDASELSNVRVVNLAYDKYDKLMWIAHYNGIQYYDLQNNTWHSIPELTHEFASAPSIYVDPFDTDKVYFSFYYEAGTKSVVGSQITDATHRIFEYSKSTKTVASYVIDSASSGVMPLITKTSADIVWVTWGKKLIKYKLSTATILQTIDLTDAVANETLPGGILYPRGLVSTVNSRGEKVVCVAFTSIAAKDDTIPQKAYVLSIRETGENTSTQTLVHNASWEFVFGADLSVQALVKDPASANTFYIGFGGDSGSACVFKSTDGRGESWTAFKPTGSSVQYLLGMTVGENGKVYATRGSYLSQQIVADFIMDGAVAVGGGMVHDSMYYDEKDNSGFVQPTTAAGYYSGDSGEGHTAQTQVEAMMFMMLDGYSVADSRFAVFRYYPQNGGGGHISHMVTMPPKCAPFAPRVDEENTKFEIIDNNKIEIVLNSPGLISSMDGFIPETINGSTVQVYDEDGNLVTPESISYDAAGRKIVIAGNFFGLYYSVKLQCGVNGIKNVKGAPLTNTRQDEFKDSIKYYFGNGIDMSKVEVYEELAENTDQFQMSDTVKCDLIVRDLWFSQTTPVAGKASTVSFDISNIGTEKASAGIGATQQAYIYVSGIKVGAVSYGDVAAKSLITLSYVIDGQYLIADKPLKVRIVADGGSKVTEMRETNNTLLKTVTVASGGGGGGSDFTGRGASDILWQNQQNGTVGIWTGSNNNTWNYLATADINSWEIVGVGDFNGNGKSDILLQNRVNGYTGMWESGTTWQGFGAVSRTDWEIVGVGDFNGNGKSDILLQNKNDGYIGMWESGTTWQGFGAVPRTDWEVVGVGDFNGNGKSDVLLQNKTNGYTGMWESGTTWQGFGAAPRTDWEVVGVGDFNGNGKSDILWQSKINGTVGMWESGTTWQGLGAADRNSWEVVSVGDYNGDGKSDILLQNISNGYVGMWKSGTTWQGIGSADRTAWKICNMKNSN